MRRGLAIIGATALLAPGVALAGANTKPAGGGIAILSAGYYWSDSSFPDGHLGVSTTPFSKNGIFDKVSAGLWLEYGLTDNLNLLAETGYGYQKFENDDGEITNSGFGNHTLGLKWRFIEAVGFGDTAWALQGRVKFPAPEDELAMGYHDYQYELKLLTSRDAKLFRQPIFVSADIGYRWRLGGASDEFRLGYDVGTMVGPWLFLLPIDADFGLRNNDDDLRQTNPQLARDSDRITIGPSVARRLDKRWWIQLGGAYDIAGRDTGQGKEVKLSAWYIF